MPEMDGFEASQAIRELGLGVPVVALTANAMKGEAERCLAAGMNDYLTKPVAAKVLQAMLSKWLKIARAGRADVA